METFTPENTQTKAVKESSGIGLNLSKVFLWMVLGLGITGVVSFFLPDLLVMMSKSFSWTDDTLGKVYIGLIIASAVLMLPSAIMMGLKAWRPKSVLMMIGFIVYALAMGVLLSSVFMVVLSVSSSSTDFMQTVGVSFLITAGAFLLMALCGMFTKKSLGVLVPFLIALLLGTLTISLVNIFLKLDWVYWLTDFIIFGVVLVVTAVDVNRAKKIAENGGFSSENNLAIYCAYTLYVDFINIFLRVLYYVMVARSKK